MKLQNMRNNWKLSEINKNNYKIIWNVLIISDRICDSVEYRINNCWNNILCIDILNIVIVMLEAET